MLEKRDLEAILSGIQEDLRNFQVDMSISRTFQEKALEAIVSVSDKISKLVCEYGNQPDLLHLENAENKANPIVGEFEEELEFLDKEEIKSELLGKYTSYEKLLGLGASEIHKIKIKGKSITDVVKLSGFNPEEYGLKSFYPQDPRDFKIFISWLFDKNGYSKKLIEVRTPEEKIAGNGKPIKVNLAKRKLTKEEIKSELLSKYGSYEELLKLSSKEISEIKILGKKVTALVTSSGFKSEEYKLKTFNPWTPIDFRIWILWLFDKL